MFPDDSIQNVTGSWWDKTDAKTPVRGHLIWAYVPHVDQVPMRLVAEGRNEPTDHQRAKFKIEPLLTSSPPKRDTLPVAAMPIYSGEDRTVYRAKKRPALVVGLGGDSVDNKLRRGKARHQTAPTLTIAPYYGATQDGSRSGFSDEFCERIRHCEYPQYLWDNLPISKPDVHSILRLDHLQPIGNHHNAYELTGHVLTEEAMTLVDEWVMWLLTGKMADGGPLHVTRELLMEL